MDREALNKTIKLDGRTKLRLEQKKESYETYNRYIERMLDFFDVLGIEPNPQFKDPYIMVEKHLVKIEAALQKDIRKLFQPALDFIENGGTLENRDEKLCKLANENQDLRRMIQTLKAEKEEEEGRTLRAEADAARKINEYKAQVFGIKSIIAEQCNPSRFSTNFMNSDLKVPVSFFDELNRKIESEYPTEEI